VESQRGLVKDEDFALATDDGHPFGKLFEDVIESRARRCWPVISSLITSTAANRCSLSRRGTAELRIVFRCPSKAAISIVSPMTAWPVARTRARDQSPGARGRPESAHHPWHRAK
jgi:hypothetical protein